MKSRYIEKSKQNKCCSIQNKQKNDNNKTVHENVALLWQRNKDKQKKKQLNLCFWLFGNFYFRYVLEKGGENNFSLVFCSNFFLFISCYALIEHKVKSRKNHNAVLNDCNFNSFVESMRFVAFLNVFSFVFFTEIWQQRKYTFDLCSPYRTRTFGFLFIFNKNKSFKLRIV